MSTPESKPEGKPAGPQPPKRRARASRFGAGHQGGRGPRTTGVTAEQAAEPEAATEPEAPENAADSAAAGQTAGSEGKATSEGVSGAEKAAEPVGVPAGAASDAGSEAAPPSAKQVAQTDASAETSDNATATAPEADAQKPGEADEAGEADDGVVNGAAAVGPDAQLAAVLQNLTPEAVAALLQHAGHAPSADTGDESDAGDTSAPAAQSIAPTGRLVRATKQGADEPQMPESVRKALRANLLSSLRRVNKAWADLETHQGVLVQAFVEAREQGLPRSEVDRVFGEAQGIGFEPDELRELLEASGWEPTAVNLDASQ